ncbi:FecR family protein [Sphingobacterium chungjuense]|uniref:FecR family protein n=1 Tax=Sphingobacterium chungjuense TaxID=2675553 RepID=UPI00140C4AA8|nr:FecR domain-containing protein [Sphingobacterium chungjuense]
MSKQSPELQQLIQRYLEGKCTAEEKVQLQHWIASLKVSDESATTEDLLRLRDRIDRITQPDEVRVKRIQWPTKYGAAAALLCIGVASFYVLRNSLVYKKHTASQIVESKFSDGVNRLRVYHNHGSDNRSVMLSDGSSVTLTPQSSIHFLDNFEADNRQVTLSGKARFDVAKDASRPFSVITGDIHTTALGTVFWVTRLHHESLPIVELLSGKIAITKKSSLGNRELLVTLNPGDRWDSKGLHLAPNTIQKPEASIKKAPAQEAEVVMLGFHHTPLREVFDTLAAHFQTQFSYSESDLEGMTFYGNYTDKVVLDDIIKHIMLTHEIQITYQEDTATYVVSIPSNLQTNDQI